MGLGELPPERDWTGGSAFWPNNPNCAPEAGPRTVYDREHVPLTGRELDKAQDLAREILWWTQQPPHQQPPFRADPIRRRTRAVLNAPSGSVAGVAAAAAIAAAEGMLEAVTTYPSAAEASNVQQTILSYTVPPSSRGVVRLWGGQQGDGAFDAVKFQMWVGGLPVSNEINLAAVSSIERMVEVFGLATEGQTVELRARLIDTIAPAYVEVGFYGWVYPCLTTDDSLRSSLSDSFGPNTNGRFGRASCPRPGSGDGRGAM